MSRESQRGADFERRVADYLRDELGDPRVDRIRSHGTKDVGDVGGILVGGRPLVIECKSYTGRDRMGTWLREAEWERENAGGVAAAVVSKRKGIGNKNMGDQLASMTLRDWSALVKEAKS